MSVPHSLPHTRVPTIPFPTPADANKYVAGEIDALVRARNQAGKPTVLGLATGSTPVGLYRELIRRHKDEGLDLSRVITFNLDEYYPMARDDAHSYFHWMHKTFFDHVNIPAANVNIPDGTLPADEVDAFCAGYEEKIRAVGGIDVQILGIGRTGHIGFNEPGSPANSRTRMVTLDAVTRRDAADGFFGEENVPHQAITMGVASIMDARRVFLLAYGEHKAGVVLKAVEQPPTEAISASILQDHEKAEFVLDAAATAELTAVKRPWEVGPTDWTPERIRQAVVALCRATKKSLHKLEDSDFRDHHLYELLSQHGPAERIGEAVFDDRLATIQAYPAGKVGRQSPTDRPGAAPALPTADSPLPTFRRRAGDAGPPKTILVFSPHPDDDVISMGGTIIRLVDQGHTVHVAYMTSGNIAVFDHDARRFLDFVGRFGELFGVDPSGIAPAVGQAIAGLDARLKKPGLADADDALKVKGLIRETEARAAALACGVPADQLAFMNLRFYRTGRVGKDPVQPEDVADIIALIRRLEPAQIYVAGEMSDPHGTHRLCAEAIFTAVREMRSDDSPPSFDVWLYRGAWEEWEPHEIEMAVPLSADVVERKKQAIFRHQSQKDKAMFPGGTDRREFWQRAEDRNLDTARTFDALGLPEYYALEAFVKWKG